MKVKMQNGNDSFIFYIRKNFPTCKYDNQVLGRLIWLWIKKHANGVKLGMPKKCDWKGYVDKVGKFELPDKATQFEFDGDCLVFLYAELNRLGSIK